MIRVKKHKAGFFSCCSVRLKHIVRYVNEYKKLPLVVDNRRTLIKYKNRKSRKDVTFDYFENYNNIDVELSLFDININTNTQHTRYSDINYNKSDLLVKKYFSPSLKVNERINILSEKYKINYENTLAVYYRGTDKVKETKLAPFDEFYNKIKEIIDKNENIKILVQTDTKKFLDYINSKDLKNIIIINENKISDKECGVHNEHSARENYFQMFNFLPTVLIISKCKYIICSSGNCSFWMMLYRGNGNNIMQYLNGKWHNSIC